MLLLIGILFTGNTPLVAEEVAPLSQGVQASFNRFSQLQERVDRAENGEQIVVSPGVYIGDLKIRRSVHLVGETGAILQGRGGDSVIEILTPGVVIENLEIRGSGTDLSKDLAGIKVEGGQAVIRGNRLSNVLHGIYVKGVSSNLIENNQIQGWDMDIGEKQPADENIALCTTGSDRRGNGIHLWNSESNTIRGNRIRNMRDGIYLSFTKKSLIENNQASECRYGLHYMYSDENHLVENHFFHNAAGSALMFSKGLLVEKNYFENHRGQRAGGMVLHSVDYSKIDQNQIVQNRTGLYLQNCNENQITGNRITKNYLGLRLTGSSTNNYFQENSTYANLHNVDLTGRDNHNRWNDGKRGNYWGSNASPDLDGDGVGDWVHAEVDILGSHRAEFPLIALLSDSPFVRAAEYIFRHIPVPGIPVIRDDRPLKTEPNR